MLPGSNLRSAKKAPTEAMVSMAVTKTYPAMRWRSEPFLRAMVMKPEMRPIVPPVMWRRRSGEWRMCLGSFQPRVYGQPSKDVYARAWRKDSFGWLAVDVGRAVEGGRRSWLGWV